MNDSRKQNASFCSIDDFSAYRTWTHGNNHVEMQAVNDGGCFPEKRCIPWFKPLSPLIFVGLQDQQAEKTEGSARPRRLILEFQPGASSAWPEPNV